MKELQSGKDKVRIIADILKKETLEPAKKEAEKIVSKAQKQADEIVSKAHKHAEELVEGAKAAIGREQQVFRSSLKQAYQQTVASLKQTIEGKLFSPELKHLVSQSARDPKDIANLIKVVIEAIEKEGLQTDLSAYISSQISPDEINKLLLNAIVARLKEKSVLVSNIGGGVQVKLHDDQITLDISDSALEEMIANFIRRDFREMIFANAT